MIPGILSPGGWAVARILVVDDESHIRDLIRAMLDFGEHELLEAHDGETALALAQESVPELIILDLGLPGKMDGLEVLRQLKVTNCSHSRFLVLTGSGSEHEKAARAAGADEFLTKPFSPLKLIERIESSLAGVD
jgi:DNA-binding response OmpR family regulator